MAEENKQEERKETEESEDDLFVEEFAELDDELDEANHVARQRTCENAYLTTSEDKEELIDDESGSEFDLSDLSDNEQVGTLKRD